VKKDDLLLPRRRPGQGSDQPFRGLELESDDGRLVAFLNVLLPEQLQGDVLLRQFRWT